MPNYFIHHILTPYRALKIIVKNTPSFIAYLLLKILTTIGLCFACTINAFFFTLMVVLLDGPSLVISFFSSLWMTESECENCIWSDGEAGCEKTRCGGTKIGGDLEGWCRIRVCGTDEISELELDDGEDGDEDENENDDEKERVMMVEKQRQSLERVRDWAARLDNDDLDIGGSNEEIVWQGDYFSLPVIGVDQNSSMACSVGDAE